MKIFDRFLMTLLLAGVLTGTVGCNESGQGNVVARLQTGTYSTAKSFFWELLFPRAHAAVSNLNVCFKRLRFKQQNEATSDPLSSEDNIDFPLGQVNLTSSGTTLADIELPANIYRRIEFDLENDCGNSMELTNGFGSFSDTSRITIKCEGEMILSSDSVIVLDVQPILTQLNAHDGSVSLKQTAESVNCSVSGVISG